MICMRKTKHQTRCFFIKNFYNLNINKGSLIAEQLNEFNIITSQLASIKIVLEDEIRAILLMCSMPDSWKNLIVSMSTSAPPGTLKFDHVSSSLMKDCCDKNQLQKTKEEKLYP